MTDKKPVVQTEGWQIIKSLIDQEVEIESKDLLDCPIEEDLEHGRAHS